VDGEINRAFQKEAQVMKERGKKVLALIPLNLDGFLPSADYTIVLAAAIFTTAAPTITTATWGWSTNAPTKC